MTNIEQRADAVSDKVQIGLTPTAEKQLDALMETGWFDDRQDVYRVAIGVALARRLEPREGNLTGVRTSYNFSGGIDRDGKLRQLMNVLNTKEVDRPGAYAERLAHAGLDFMHQSIVKSEGTLSDALDPDQGAAWS